MIETWIALAVVIVLVLVFIVPGFALIRDDKVGILTRKMFGSKLPEGKIIATRGEIGVQAETLMPGLYWRFPLIWSIESANVTRIAPGNIGTVESVDGKPLPSGRLLGDDVECDSYQNAKLFLENSGYKGLQLGILKPGTYRINTKVFTVSMKEATEIKPEFVGVVTALDGIPLPSTRIIAPAPEGEHRHFTDGQAFISSKGYRGPQLETLQPGQYYINPFLFTVTSIPISVVPPGYVAVVISSVGEEPEASGPAPKTSMTPNLDQPIVTDYETALITNKTLRGILKDPVYPGKYNLNNIAYKIELVPTSAVTIKWSTEELDTETRVRGVPDLEASLKANEFYRYSQLRSTSKDGFQLDVDVKLIIRIPPEKAPYVISRFGSVNNLIEQVVHPLIDSSFRNEAGNKQAMEFIHNRTSLQETSLQRAQAEFGKYHVEVQGLLIAYIKVDEKLLETQTKKEIAVQQQEQYNQEAKAQDSRIAVAEKTARADQQSQVIQAKLSIDIATDRAEAARREAAGTRDATIERAKGTAFEAEAVGKATASAYQAQTDVLGRDKVAILKLMQIIADNNVVITPKVNVSGGTGGNDNNTLMNTFLATLLEKGTSDEDTSSGTKNESIPFLQKEGTGGS